MKRTVSILLCMALLLGLGACGENSESSVPSPSSAPAEPVSIAEEGDYIVPAGWTENSVNDGNFGYVTAGAGLPEGADIDGGHLVCQDRDDENGTITLTQYALDGTEEHTVTIPMAEDVEYQYVGYYAFGENSLWMTYYTNTLVNEETGELESYGQLQNWSYDGTCLTAVSIEEALGISLDEGFVSALALDEEGNPLLVAVDRLYFCGCDGKPAATAELPSTGGGFCRDSSGRLYVQVSYETVYTINWEEHTLGSELFSPENGGSVFPGGGDYDFLVKDNTRLLGVSLQNGTITEILSWADWDLSDQVGGVAWLDEDTFLITVHSLLGDDSQLLTFTRVPAGQISEKTTVRLAVELSQRHQEWGEVWTDCVDAKVIEAINQFNRASDTYRIEVETYADSTALQLQMASGDFPDLFYWGPSGYVDDMPSLELMAKKGYLTDLEPLIEEDEELSADDFIPSVLNLAREQSGGLYAMPLSYYFITLAAPAEYVGTETGWTISDMLSAARKMPEDMDLWGDMTQAGMLDEMLRCCISDFIDVENAACDFATQEFYDLLTLCRDYCYAEPPGESYAAPSGGTLLHGYGTPWEELVEVLENPGMTIIGYPGAGENGTTLVFYQQMALCAYGAQSEGAWEFLRTLLGYDFQKNIRAMEYSVRQDWFTERQNQIMQSNSKYTEEAAETVRQMIFGATQLRTTGYPCSDIIQEETAAFFAGDKTAQETAELINSRVRIYLSEQS